MSRLRSEPRSQRATHGCEARSGKAPAAGRALGQGSSGRGPAHGARNREPRRAKAKVSGIPPRAGPKLPSRPRAPRPPPTTRHTRAPRGGLWVHGGGLHFGKGRPPHRAAPRPLPDPQTHPLRGTGGPRRPAAARPPPPAAARWPPPAQPRRPWLLERGVPAAQSARRRPAGVMLRGGRPSGAGGRASFSSTPAAPRAAAPAREGPRNGPRRGAGPRPLPIRRRRPRPRTATSGSGAPSLRPERSGPRSANAETDGRADRRTRGRAGGHLGRRVAGGRRERGLLGRKQRGPSAGPRAGGGKRRRGSAPGRDSAPGRGPGGVGGGPGEGGPAPPGPARRPPRPGPPRRTAPGASQPRGRPRPPATRVRELGGAPHAGPSDTEPFFNVSMAISFPWTLGGSF